MALIYETPNFIVESHEKPFVPREEGGHIRIKIKDPSVVDRTMLTPEQAREFIRLSMIIGKALEIAMNNRDVKVVKVNYQDMGNWAYKEGRNSYFHCHIFGRVLGANHQPFPESVYLPDRSTGFYNGFTPLDEEDIAEIKNQIGVVMQEAKYDLHLWNLP